MSFGWLARLRQPAVTPCTARGCSDRGTCNGPDGRLCRQHWFDWLDGQRVIDRVVWELERAS